MKKKKTTIKWCDSITIENICEKRDELLAAFDKSTVVVIDLSAMTSVDITAVQLVVAGQREANRKQIDFSLVGDLQPDIIKFCIEIGIPLGDVKTGEEFSSDILQRISGDENARSN